MKDVIVVESPAKTRTLKKFLGEKFQVVASWGHIRDLPRKELGVDIENSYQPKYRLVPGRQKTVSYLKKAFEGADKIYLATDLDREGEAIAWHVVKATKIDKVGKVRIARIVFSEITKRALQEALKNPRQIDMNLVDAQQARRILDRLVGYKLSPFLWNKIMKGLSAGRVQSVAVRLVVEKEKEIEGFKPQEYWEIWAELLTGKKERLQAQLVQIGDKRVKKLDLKDQAETQKIVRDLEKAKYQVDKIEKDSREKHPFPPYTTSTLQQDATRRLRMGAKRVMRLAQDLYEAGKITYMRTDSLNLAWVAVNSIRKYIKERIGEDYLPEKPRGYRVRSKGAQEAHEAIRPVYIAVKAADLDRFSPEHRKIYKLIWQRTIACQMKAAVIDNQKISIRAGKYGLEAKGQEVKFDGFIKVYPFKIAEEKLPPVTKKEMLDLEKLSSKQLFTKPPARYNQASLIKKLEELGIGRPSTYVPIIDTIQRRGYVVFQQGFFYPTSVGRLVTRMLVKNFEDVVDYDFTAKMEEDLDKIAQGKRKWQEVIDDFYQPFSQNLAKKEKLVKKQIIKIEGEGEPCPKCGKKMVIKSGKFGKFLACSGYPDCQHTQNIQSKIGMRCPDCRDGDVIERRSKKGKIFYGCNRYPECKFISWERPKK
jgi:DNA topoisomerase-1